MGARRSTLILLLALLGAGILGAAWWLARQAREPGESAALPGAEEGAAAPAAARGELARPGRPGDVEDDRAVLTAEARAEGFDLAHAIWLEGRVVLPSGTPADEQIALVGIGYPESGPDLETLGERAKSARFLEHFSDGEEGATRAVRALEPDGTFRLPFAQGSRRAVIAIDARYAYLDPPQVVELPHESVTLEPRLGAWLTGRLVLPAGASEASALAGTEVQVFGYSLGGGGMQRSAIRVSPELTFEAGGLRPELSYGVIARPDLYVAEPILGLDLAAGTHVERPIELSLGATVRGLVVDEGGAPVEGAFVNTDVERGFSVSGTTRTAETDATGSFALRGIAPGKLTVTATAEGWVPAREEGLELADGQEAADLRLVLRRGNSLAGRVLWPEGAPAAGAEVVATESVSVGAGRGAWARETEHGGQADASGAFRIQGLGEGPFALRASALRAPPGGAEDSGDGVPAATWYARRADVQAGAEVELRLEPPSALRGRAIDDTGAPVHAFSVQLVPGPPLGQAEGAGLREIESEDGRFEVGGLESGTWSVRLVAEGHGPSEERQVRVPDASVIDFVLPRAAAVRGLVLDGYGAPIAGAEVRPSYGREPEGRSVTRNDRKALSDERGGFELVDLAPGPLSLRAKAEGFAPGAGEPLELAPGEVREGVQLELGRGGTLTGEVYTSEGLPDTGRRIQVGTMGRMGGGGSALADASGRFQVEHLAPGSYQVVTMPDAAQLERGGDPAQIMAQLKMTSAEIREGETTHVVLGAPPKAPVRLHGRVTAAGAPLAGGLVMAFAEGATMLASMKMARADERGAYELRLDAPGDYTLIASREMGGDEGSEFHATIPEVAEHRLDLELPLGRLGGSVRGPDGAPLANARVTLEREDAFSLLSLEGRRTRADGEGRYGFEGLAPGVYTVRAEPPPGHDELAVAVRGGVVIDDDSATAGIDLRLARAGAIEGRVMDASRKPAEGAWVYVRDAQGRIVKSAIQTDAGGRFRAGDVAAGRYTLLARKGDLASRESAPIHVAEGEGSKVELVLEPGTLLRVSVEDGEGRAVRSSLSVTDEQGRELARLLGRETLEAVLSEGVSSTEQRVGPLPPGRYTVRAAASGGREATKPVTLSGQGERRLKLRLE